MRYARIDNGRVAEVMDLPGGVTPAELYHPALAAAMVLAGAQVAVGWAYEEGVFSPPPAPPDPVPASVTPLQARRALRAAGLLEPVEAAISAADPDTQDAWRYAQVIERNNPALLAIAETMSLSPAQIDDLFRAAVAG